MVKIKKYVFKDENAKPEDVEIDGVKCVKMPQVLAVYEDGSIKVHPMFVRDGVEHDSLYLSSYEIPKYNEEMLKQISKNINKNIKDCCESHSVWEYKEKSDLNRKQKPISYI